MKIIILSIVFCNLINPLYSQNIFTDSGQLLGNSVSWDVKVGDIDNDGDIDAVVANWGWGDKYQPNEIWLNNGKGFFSKSPQVLGSSQRISIYDIDSDGDKDIIEDAEVNNYSTPIKVWMNNGTGRFTFQSHFLFEGSSIVFTKSINNNDQLSAITIMSSGFASGDSSTIRIYNINNNIISLLNTFIVNNFSVQNLSVGDLNNDGYSDFVLCQNGPNLILINNKNNTFNTSQILPGTYNTGSIVLCDFNGDNYLDILQGNYHNPLTGVVFPVKLYMNDTSGKFKQAPLSYNTSDITNCPIAADFDRDGDSDIFMNHGHAFTGYSQKSEILINDGNANFTAQSINISSVKSISISAGDFDNDSDTDIYLACGDADTLVNQDRVWLNNTIKTSIKSHETMPEESFLYQNPNPFNTETKIPILIKNSKVPEKDRVNAVDMPAIEIKTIINREMEENEYPATFDGSKLSSGIDFYILTAGEKSFIRKMNLIK